MISELIQKAIDKMSYRQKVDLLMYLRNSLQVDDSKVETKKPQNTSLFCEAIKKQFGL